MENVKFFALKVLSLPFSLNSQKSSNRERKYKSKMSFTLFRYICRDLNKINQGMLIRILCIAEILHPIDCCNK